jgi:AmpD protein
MAKLFYFKGLVKKLQAKRAKQVPSLNYNERPNDKVSLVVIHNISLPPKQFGGDCVEQFFTNQLDFGNAFILSLSA